MFFPIFTAVQHLISSKSRVMGCDNRIGSMIKQFGFRDIFHHFQMVLQQNKKQKKSVTKIFPIFYCWQHFFVHISGHGCDKRIRFSTFFIIFRWFYSKIKNKKIGDKNFPFLLLAALFGPYLGSWV